MLDNSKFNKISEIKCIEVLPLKYLFKMMFETVCCVFQWPDKIFNNSC